MWALSGAEGVAGLATDTTNKASRQKSDNVCELWQWLTPFADLQSIRVAVSLVVSKIHTNLCVTHAN